MEELAKEAGLEALKTWGAYGLCLLLLGAIIGALWWSNRAKDGENEKLRAENTHLQELRLQDAQKLIDVTQAGTATMIARAEGDARFRELLSQLVDRVSMLSQFVDRLSLMTGLPRVLPPPFPPESR